MALRPSQIRATTMDGALMIPGALALRGHYKDLSLPVIIIAGEGDKIVFKRRSEQLAGEIQGSALQIVKGAGHMLHRFLALDAGCRGDRKRGHGVPRIPPETLKSRILGRPMLDRPAAA